MCTPIVRQRRRGRTRDEELSDPAGLVIGCLVGRSVEHLLLFTVHAVVLMPLQLCMHQMIFNVLKNNSINHLLPRI